ncbi:hypothetical protein B0H17DRAFT_1177727 [Mycena rosella]|uniref:Uncharacterized protein n=1 Tax=Mycena rosella TaxID=1033263 RepID=A0AAD7DSJ1_MYCRO|nr:hypothetical protein B0H17DRAFT_1177727 [Mycena rosella]
MATVNALRQVLVDDTDPAIDYGPEGWFVADPSTLNRGNFGPIYNGTSRATTSSNSTLSYSFNGTSILVQGTIAVSTNPDTNITDPTWNCFVDGIQIPNSTFGFPENNWPLCKQEEIASGSHTLTIQVKSRGQPFYFDSLIYTPTRDAVFPSAVLIYPDGDPALNYSAGWKEDGEQLTQTQNAQVTLRFHGTAATLIGHVPNQYPPNATSASYTIDGGPPISFPLNGLASATSSTQFNSLFFTTPALPDGFHTLAVTHGGDLNHTPLAVKFFYTSVSSQGSSTATTSPTSSIPPRRTNTGAIVGGVVGGLALLGFLAVLVLWRRKRQRRDLEQAATRPFITTTADDTRSPAPLPGICSDTSPVSGSETSGPGPWAMPVSPSRIVRGISDVLGGASREKGGYPTPPPAFMWHQDSGVRQNSASSATASDVVELPPGYTPT